jgi:hypothetical protein
MQKKPQSDCPYVFLNYMHHVYVCVSMYVHICVRRDVCVYIE